MACSEDLCNVTLHAMLRVDAELMKAVTMTAWFEMCPPEEQKWEWGGSFKKIVFKTKHRFTFYLDRLFLMKRDRLL